MRFFELCAESLDAALAGQRAGVHRLELCSDLRLGGVTPSEELLAQVLQAVSIPVHVLIRPRAGDFVYTEEEFARILREIDAARAAGASGVVLGVLRASAEVDVERTSVLVEHARPLRVTFHRAFDETTDLEQALEAVIATGADALLTSGGAPDCLAGAERIAGLIRQAAGRIELLAGAGITLDNFDEVARRTGARWLHGSLTRRKANPAVPFAEQLTIDLRAVLEHFQKQCEELGAPS